MRFGVYATVAVCFFLSGCTSQMTDRDDDDDREVDEAAVTMDQLPAAVQATLTKESAGGKIDEIDRVIDDGRTIYEADVLLGGKKWEIAIRDDGQLVSKELDEEKDDEDKKDD